MISAGCAKGYQRQSVPYVVCLLQPVRFSYVGYRTDAPGKKPEDPRKGLVRHGNNLFPTSMFNCKKKCQIQETTSSPPTTQARESI